MKEIVLPKGFEIDFEKSTKNKVILKIVEEKKLPEKVEDLGLKIGYYVNIYGNVNKISAPREVSLNWLYASEKAAKSAYAKQLLSFLMKEYNGDWEPNWSDYEKKYVIGREGDKIETYIHRTAYEFLAFKTAALRDKFLLHFERLIKDYFELD